RPFRTDDHARRLQPDLEPMRAVVALGGGVGSRIDVERVVGTRLHAGLAADAAAIVEVHDAVAPAIERDGGTDGDAGRGVAVVAAQHREVPPRVGERALLDVLYPGAEAAQGHAVLFLACHRAGVAADALAVIDDEAVTHAALLPQAAEQVP